MTPDPDLPHHAHHTGHRRLDLTLALSAVFVSVVSLVVAVRHGATMERMAEANARLVAANSWPFLGYGTDNQDVQGHPHLQLRVVNVGVGPARIETFEVFWRGEPVGSAEELLERCCGLRRDSGRAKATFGVGVIAPTVLRAGDSESSITMSQTDNDLDLWNRLNSARLDAKLRACCCSVFDDCWTGTLQSRRAERVTSCPVPKVPYVIPQYALGIAPAAGARH